MWFCKAGGLNQYATEACTLDWCCGAFFSPTKYNDVLAYTYKYYYKIKSIK